MLKMRIMPKRRAPRMISEAGRVPPAIPIDVAAPVNVWAAYGLAGNPFFQEELRSEAGAFYPISLHVGRDEELKLALRHLGGGPSTRLMVEGAPGIGKTSFVNKLKAELARSGMLTHSDPVRIYADSTVLGFVADVLRVLLRMRATFKLDGNAFWTRTARIVEGEDTRSGGFSMGPVGVSYEPGRVPAEAPLGNLYEVVREALERLRDDLGSPVLLHVNNLENLSEDDAGRAARLIRDLRDFFLLPGANWVFVGATGVDDRVFRAYDQVAGIFPDPITLEPLRADEVAELLRRRYEHLAQPGAQVVPPVDAGVAAELYPLYNGDLRNFLRLLSDASALALGIEGVGPLSAERIVAAAAPRYAKAIERRIGSVDLDYLARVLRDSPAAEFTVGTAAVRTGLGQSGASRFIARLRNLGMLIHTRTEGKRVLYRPAGQVLVALGYSPASLPRGSAPATSAG